MGTKKKGKKKETIMDKAKNMAEDAGKTIKKTAKKAGKAVKDATGANKSKASGKNTVKKNQNNEDQKSIGGTGSVHLNNEGLLKDAYLNVKGACQSLRMVIDKAKDQKFKDELGRQYDEYMKIAKEIEKLGGDNKPKEPNLFDKAKMWANVSMGTMNDASTRKLAQTIIMGTFNGSIDCIFSIDDNPNASTAIVNVVKKLMQIEEQNAQKLKQYLKKE